MARAARHESARWERSGQETGYGVGRTSRKRTLAAEDVWNYFRGLRTVGVVSESKDVVEMRSAPVS